MPREQARDHAVGADPERRRLQGHDQLHRPPGRPRRRRRLDRGLVPQQHDGRPTTAASSPPSRSARWPGCRSTTTRASSRRTTSTTRSPIGKTGDRARRARRRDARRRLAPLAPTPVNAARRELPRRLADVALEVARADRELPGREQHRLLRPDRAHAPDRASHYYQALGERHHRRAQGAQQGDMDQQEDITELPEAVQRAVPVHDQRRRRRPAERRASRRRCRRRSRSATARRSTPSLGTFHHENMHQWWGDNVSEDVFNLTFFKEGYATVGEYLNTARTAANAAGGLGTPAGDAAFETSLDQPLQHELQHDERERLDVAPSNPTVGEPVHDREHLHAARARPTSRCGRSSASDRDDRRRMKEIQTTYGGGSITEPQLEDAFHKWLPNQIAGLPRASSTSSSRSGATPRTRAAAARTSRRSPGPAWPAPASSARRRSPTTSRRRRRPASNGWYTGNVTIDVARRQRLRHDDDHDRLRQPDLRDRRHVHRSRARRRTRSAPRGRSSVTVKRDATAPATTATLDADADRGVVLAANGDADRRPTRTLGRRVDELPPRRRRRGRRTPARSSSRRSARTRSSSARPTSPGTSRRRRR